MLLESKRSENDCRSDTTSKRHTGCSEGHTAKFEFVIKTDNYETGKQAQKGSSAATKAAGRGCIQAHLCLSQLKRVSSVFSERLSSGEKVERDRGHLTHAPQPSEHGNMRVHPYVRCCPGNASEVGVCTVTNKSSAEGSRKQSRPAHPRRTHLQTWPLL